MWSEAGVAVLLEAFAENFRESRETGASLSVWADGTEIVRRGYGWCEPSRKRPWTAETLVPVYSSTKGPASAALLLALARHGLGPETPVREVWPGFPVARADFGQMMSWQCGLAALGRKASVWDHDAGVAAVEAQLPEWLPGGGHGYHPRSAGVLLDEPVRRLTGMKLGDFWQREIAAPLGLELWIGLPEREFGRVAELYPARMAGRPPDAAFSREYMKKGSLTWRAFHCFEGLESVREMNSPRAWAASLPAMGGVATAAALAKFYQAAAGLVESPLPESVRRWLAMPRSAGADRVLCCDTVFTCGCQMDPVDAGGAKTRQLFGPSPGAFGHSGAGGSHAFGDPETGISFAYVMNRMEAGVLPGRRCESLVRALFA